MASTAFVRARISESLKNEAAGVLAEMGLTVSDLVRITLTRVARDKALPFDLNTPNVETKAAIAESRAMMKNKNARFSDGQELIDALEQKSR
jgi:DNA-damage-inducible protein J